MGIIFYQKTAWTEYKDTMKFVVQTKDSIINKQGEIIYIQKAIVTQSKKELKRVTQEKFNLKKSDERKIREVIAYYKQTSTIVIPKPIVVRYTDTVPVPSTTDTAALLAFFKDSSITVPRKAIIDSPDIKLNTSVTKTGLILESVDFPDTTYGRFTVKSQGLFKPDIVEYQTFHTNKYIKTDVKESMITVPKKKKFLRKLAEGAILVGTGILMGLASSK